MALSPHELGIIVVGLAVGYWVVSYLLGDRGRKPDAPGTKERPELGASPRDAAPWWAVLGVSPDASRAEIVQAYKRRISEYHPDKVAHMGEEIRSLAAQRAQEINAAYDEAMRRP